MILWSPVFTFTTMTASLIRILWACFTQRCSFMNVDIINTTVILTVFFTTTFDFTGRFNIGLDVILTSAIVIMIMWRGQLLSAWPASLWWDRRLTLLLLECHASAACLCKMIAFTTLITNETPGSTWMITWTCIAQTPTACLTCWSAVAAALMRPIPPEAGHYRDKSAHPMDARMHPKGVRGPCCVR